MGNKIKSSEVFLGSGAKEAASLRVLLQSNSTKISSKPGAAETILRGTP